jgi:SAM-dependent methyltransferase
VDIGCGDGYWVTNLPSGIQGIGVDVSDAAFPAQRSGDAGPRFICADARNIPLDAGIADVVFLLDVIEHVREDRLLLQEVRRVLAPNGRLILSTPNASSFGHRNKAADWFAYRDATHCNLQGYEYWARLLTASGFRCLRMGSDFPWDPPYRIRVPIKAQWFIAGVVGILTRFMIGFLPWRQGENVLAIAQANPLGHDSHRPDDLL